MGKREKMNSENDVYDDQPPSKPDLLELMMQLSDSDTGSKMSNTVIQSNVLTFMVAGFEGTSTCLIWTLYLLALHGDKQEKAREEILNASPTNVDITVESIERMSYLECVIKESLRLHSPAALLARETLEPVTLGGVSIPKGYEIHIPIGYLHRSEGFWTEPLEFKPERFDADGEKETKDLGFQYLPFSFGPKGCLGNKFAMLELKIIIASLLKKFRFSISPNHPKIETRTILTTRPVPSPTFHLELL